MKLKPEKKIIIVIIITIIITTIIIIIIIIVIIIIFIQLTLNTVKIDIKFVILSKVASWAAK